MTSTLQFITGIAVSELRYTAWGEVRTQAGTTSTSYAYTGQYSNTADFGLMFYNARWYDSQLGRFAQADSIVPGGVQGYDRYAYVNNNPIKYTDPSGHKPCWATAHYSCDKNDVTDWLARALTDTASSTEISFVSRYLFGEGVKGAGSYFVGMAMYLQIVRPGGKFDVKLEILNMLGNNVKIGNKWYEYSVTGNILFGYYSNAAGFDLKSIQKGAGWAQRYDYKAKGCPDGPACDAVLGTKDTYSDSPDDFSAIQFGYELFDSDAAIDGVITADELTTALDNYVGPYPLNIVNGPRDFVPGGPYPTDYFYQ